MSRSDSSRAAAVSRALRTGGLAPLPSGTHRSREGVRVSASVLATTGITVGIDAPGQRARVAADIVDILTQAGYEVTETGRDDGWGGYVIYRVSKES